MLIPQGQNILVSQLPGHETTESGFILTKEEKNWESGIVERVGPGVTLSDGSIRPITDIKKGDMIFWRKYTQEPIQDGETKYLVVPYSEVLAKMAK